MAWLAATETKTCNGNENRLKWLNQLQGTLRDPCQCTRPELSEFSWFLNYSDYPTARKALKSLHPDKHILSAAECAECARQGWLWYKRAAIVIADKPPHDVQRTLDIIREQSEMAKDSYHLEELTRLLKDNKPIFRELNAEEVNVGSLEATEVSSLCMECGKDGTTRLLLTKIPMFREVIVSSFSCPHCNHSNTSTQLATDVQDKGVKFLLRVENAKDLNRQVVKADTASLSIPELAFEVPSNTQEGGLSTVEGIITRAVEGLEQEQPLRRVYDPELAKKIDDFVDQLKNLLQVEKPFTLVIDDPCGNSFVESTEAPSVDPQLTVEYYTRTQEQDLQLGIQQTATVSEPSQNEPTVENDELTDEVMVFPMNCSQCQSPCETRMKSVAIPHFKEVIIMALTCDICGYRSNEVKSGAGVSPKGTRITLHLTDPSDLSRDILKAETATLLIPELEFEVGFGSLGGRFTTVEGLLDEVSLQLKSLYPFAFGDSSAVSSHSKMQEFVQKLQEIRDGNCLNVHIILDDPAGNSYIQNVYAPEEDPELKVEHYTRSPDQNELLGLDQMNVD